MLLENDLLKESITVIKMLYKNTKAMARSPETKITLLGREIKYIGSFFSCRCLTNISKGGHLFIELIPKF